MPEMQAANAYLVIYVQRRPRLALPMGPRKLRMAAIRRLQPTSWKRRMFRCAVRWCVRLGLDRRLFNASRAPLPETCDFSLDDWLAHVSRALDAPDLAAAVVWPPQADRGRVYVHLFQRSGEAVGFAKISFDPANDALLTHEAQVLEHVAALNLQRCRPPRVLTLDHWHGHNQLVLEPVPEAAAPLPVGLETYPQPWVTEYAGATQHLTVDEVRQLDWWQRFTQQAEPSTAFTDVACAAITDGVKVCRVHGDYGGHNLLADGERPWLLDWEHSHEQGPHRTDELRLWLGLNQALVLSNPGAGVRRFAAHFLEGAAPEPAREAIAALAYLRAAEIRSASLLVGHWPPGPLQ